MKFIRVKSSFYGVHHWPQAPKPVEHLQNLHAHIFEVSAKIAVDHGNRNVEFFIAKDNLGKSCAALQSVLSGPRPDMSCEDMAEWLATYLKENFFYVISEVTVSEPGIGDGVYQPD
jgi:hypothetical protein